MDVNVSYCLCDWCVEQHYCYTNGSIFERLCCALSWSWVKIFLSTIIGANIFADFLTWLSVQYFVFVFPVFQFPYLLKNKYNLNNIISQTNWALGLYLLFLWNSFMPTFCTVVDLTSGFVNIVIWICKCIC